MRHRLFLLLLTLALPISTVGAPQTTRETHRIRIGNHKGGAVEVSLDRGQNWATVGRVTQPATDTGAGFAALSAAAPGSVAAVSLDGITVRTDRAPAWRTPTPRIFRLLPAGGVAGAAGVGTDLPRGHAIFGSLAPPLGAELLLEGAAGSTRPLPDGYIPQVGDHLIIVARVPASAPAMLVFENREGGRVLSVSASGDETVVGQVRQPLRGVARYPATAGAPCGGVVLHHPAAVMVATTPAGPGEPGGFLIQPASAFRPSGVQANSGERSAYPAKSRADPPLPDTHYEIRNMPERLNAQGPEEGAVLVVDRLAASGPAFGVPIALSPVGGSLAGETRVEARLDGGPWEPLPAAGGAAPAAFTAEALSKQFAALGAPRSLSDGVTHLRLVLAPPSPERLRAALAEAIAATGVHMAAVPPPGRAPRPASHNTAATHAKFVGTPARPASKQIRKATKTLRVVASIQGRGIVYVMFYVDGHIRKMTNTPPFDWLWDTRTTANGTHSLEIRGADAAGRVLTTQTQQVAVYN